MGVRLPTILGKAIDDTIRTLNEETEEDRLVDLCKCIERMEDLMTDLTGKALLRLAKHFCSLSPAFEVFSTQISSHSIITNLTFGGARYIATGRSFATSRISFAILFSRFAGPSIYLGMRTLLMLLYVTLSFWTGYLVYFWISIVALCVAPFLFNPHQFSFTDFIVDYR